MKTNYGYFYDKNGVRIVKYLGRTDYLKQDVDLILRKIGISSNFSMPHINQSKHQHRDYYFKNRLIRNYLNRKYKRDIQLYQLVEEEMKNLI
jgi:hypothetical protein